MAKLTSEIGVTGLVHWRGVVEDEPLRELRGLPGVRRYNEMRLSEPVIAAPLLAIEQGIRGCDWSISGPEDDERVRFVQDALDDIDLHDHLSEALTMLAFGWSWFEIVYRREAGRLLWECFSPRGQDSLLRWEMDERGKILGMVQAGSDWRPVVIPADKSVHYRTRNERNNPEGRSMLRAAWQSYYFLKNLRGLEGIGAERDLAGLPVITLPQGATTGAGSDSDASVANKFVRNIRQDEQAGLVLPFGWSFALVSSSGGKSFDLDKIIRRYEQRILLSFLAQFLSLGQDGTGSLALSSDLSNLFQSSVNAIADNIARTFTQQAIKPLLEYNGFDPEGISLEHSPAGDVDFSAYTDALQKVADKLTWTPADEAWLRGLLNMPEQSQDETEAEDEPADMEEPEPPDAGEMPDDSEDEPAQQMSAVNPNDSERRVMERRYERLVRAFLADQQKRVTTGVRKLAR